MFQISPGVNVSEIDLSTGVPGVSTTEAAIAGVFRWGPVGKSVLTNSEPDLATKFGKPTSFNAETWFVAANFLGYGNALHVARIGNPVSAIAVFSGSTANASLNTVNNDDVYEAGDLTLSANVAYVAKYPGELGNSLRVSVCDSADAYNKSVALVANADVATTSNVTIAVGSTTALISIGFTGSGTQATANAQAYAVANTLSVGDNIKVGNSTIGTQYVKIASVGAVTGNSTISKFTLTLAEPYRLHTTWASNTVNRFWEFHNVVDSAPGTSTYVQNFGDTAAVDEVHVVVVDNGGKFTGVPGTVLEVHEGLSRASDAKTDVGEDNFYRSVINNKSRFLWWASDRVGATADVAATITSASTIDPLDITLSSGSDGDNEGTIALANIAQGYDLFKDANDISFILGGKARETDGATVGNYLIDNLAETRKDCVVTLSPPKELVVNNVGQEAEVVVGYANALRGSSYAVLDSGYKYQYDKYNDMYRWVPLNGDIAGLCVRADVTHDAWWSPGGLNRGQISNVVKLAYNPKKAERDLLYKNSVNPVITVPGDGTVLFGDKTLLKKSSAFDRINVRRLFIVLEKAIAKDADRMLFEFNDEFTRAQFRNRVVPFLRDIMGRRGITDFLVVCDDTNNTGEVIDREEFVGDIYVKPNRAINFIQLNFVAVRSGVQFSEIVGGF